MPLLATVAAANEATASLGLVASSHMGLTITPTIGCALALIQLGVVLISNFVGVVFHFARVGCLFIAGWLLAHECLLTKTEPTA